MDQSKASRGLWASSRFKPYAMFTHEEQRETWKMHTCAHSMGSKPHSFWYAWQYMSSVLLGLQLMNQQRLCEHGISSNHKLCKLNPKQITQSLNI